MLCPNCQKANLKPARVPTRRELAGRLYRADVEGSKCPHCGVTSIASDAVASFELGIARDVAHRGPMTPETLQFMRKAAGLRSVDLARLLDVAPETITRWEKGDRAVDRAAWLLVGQLVLDAVRGVADTRVRLASTQRPRDEKTVDILPAPRVASVARALELVVESSHLTDQNIADILKVPVRALRRALEPLQKKRVLEVVDQTDDGWTWEPVKSPMLEDLLARALEAGVNVNAPIEPK